MLGGGGGAASARTPRSAARTPPPPRSADRSLRWSLDEALGESPLVGTSLATMHMPTETWSPSPQPRLMRRSPEPNDGDDADDDGSMDDDDDEEEDDEDDDYRPPLHEDDDDDGEDGESNASANDTFHESEHVLDTSFGRTRKTPSRISPPRSHAKERKPPSASKPMSHTPRRTPATSRPIVPASTDYYDTIDFDKITDPFKDTRRAFMRGQAAEPPAASSPPRRASVQAASTSREPSPRKESGAAFPTEAASDVAAAPMRSPAVAVAVASPRRKPAVHASPTHQAEPRSRMHAPSPPQLPSTSAAPRPPASSSPIASVTSRRSPTASPIAPVARRRSPTPTPMAMDSPPKPRVASPPKPSPPKATHPRPTPRSPVRAIPPTSPPQQMSAFASRSSPPPASSSLPSAPAPTRSNRLLTEELLKWKKRCAELEDELDAMQDRLDHAQDWSSEQTTWQQQVEQLQRGREQDRRAMRQRVRVLESHMADTKIEYDNRYWRLLTSSSDPEDTVHVQLVLEQNRVTQLQAALAEERRRVRLAEEHTAFLVGLHKWRGTQALAAQTDEVQALRSHLAHVEQQLAMETAAREAAEAALASSSASSSRPLPAPTLTLPAGEPSTIPPPSPSPSPSPAPTPAPPPALDMPLRMPPTEPGMPTASLADVEGIVSVDEAPVIVSPTHLPTHTMNDEADITPPPRTLQPGLTPMLQRTAVTAVDLNADETPMLGTRIRPDLAEEAAQPARPVARKKKRKLLGSGAGFFKLNEGTATLSPGLDVPTDLALP